MTNTFIKGVGRLATDRYDFQNHINGNPPHHKAGIITLDPAIVINSVSCTNVQSAITQLAPFAVAIPDASISTKGIVQLAGDLSGTATSVVASASKLRGYDVSIIAPTIMGQVLTWNSSSSYWYPAAIPNQFTAGNDLAGTSTNQQVIGITGISDQISIKCNTLHFDGDLLGPQIVQEGTTSAGATLTIIAQQSSVLEGGNVEISGGYGNDGSGGVKLQIQPTDSTFSTLLHAASIDNRRVLGLVSNTEITDTEMPTDTGDLVVYLKNAVTAPSSSTGVKPVGGCVLYSSTEGLLCVKQSNGQVKIVGSSGINTPIYYWGEYGDSGFPTEIRKFTVTTTAGSRQNLFYYTFGETPNIVMAEIDVVGITDDYSERHSSKRIISFASIASGGDYSFSVLGTESILHEQENVLSGAFTSTFYDSGFHDLNTILFMSGEHSLKTSTWSICIKLHFGNYT